MKYIQSAPGSFVVNNVHISRNQYCSQLHLITCISFLGCSCIPDIPHKTRKSRVTICEKGFMIVCRIISVVMLKRKYLCCAVRAFKMMASRATRLEYLICYPIYTCPFTQLCTFTPDSVYVEVSLIFNYIWDFFYIWKKFGSIILSVLNLKLLLSSTFGYAYHVMKANMVSFALNIYVWIVKTR